MSRSIHSLAILRLGSRIILALPCIVAVVVVAVLLRAEFVRSPSLVVFHQHYIELVTRDRDVGKLSSSLSRLRSFLSYRWNQSLNQHSATVSYDIDQVFDLVFRELPTYAIVYPSEQYYYFRIPSMDLGGNLRFAERDKGSITFAFYKLSDNRNFRVKELSLASLGAVQSEAGIRLTYRDKTAFFELPPVDTAKPDHLSLLPSEQFIARLLDESGVRFYLLYHRDRHAFYYLLDDEVPRGDLYEVLAPDLVRDPRTSFVYFVDQAAKRTILVGVAALNIMQNNYYDGPFDQVPPRLDLRTRLYEAYPYTQYLHGLDPYGNFIDWHASRVAISPYTTYWSTNDLLAVVARCSVESAGESDPSRLWACLTYEEKRDFHKTLPEHFTSDGKLKGAIEPSTISQ